MDAMEAVLQFNSDEKLVYNNVIAKVLTGVTVDNLQGLKGNDGATLHPAQAENEFHTQLLVSDAP